MGFNISKIREETSATKELIHFNNAGAGLMPDIVLQGVKIYLDHEASIGGYETAALFENELNNFYDQAANLINANANEIAFVESATVAWQRAFQSIRFEKGDVIWTCSTEYASNYIAYLRLANLVGVEIRLIPNDKHGVIDSLAFSKLITTDAKLISVCHMPSANGIVNPIESIGKIAKEHSVLYLVDACQSIGQYPLDVEKIKCDFLPVTGRKYLRGPRGTGFLYARRKSTNNLEPISLDLHSAEWMSHNKYEMRADAKKYETWECNFAGKYGLGSAIKYVNAIGIGQVYKRVKQLASKIRRELEKSFSVTIHDTGLSRSGIVTFTVDDVPPARVKEELKKFNINVSIAVASTAILDLKARQIDEVVRASVHYYNTEEEIARFVNVINSI